MFGMVHFKSTDVHAALLILLVGQMLLQNAYHKAKKWIEIFPML